MSLAQGHSRVGENPARRGTHVTAFTPSLERLVVRRCAKASENTVKRTSWRRAIRFELELLSARLQALQASQRPGKELRYAALALMQAARTP